MGNSNSLLSIGSTTLLINLLSIAIKFFCNLILAWLLLPEMFGISAIIAAIITGMILLSDVGINDSIIRHNHGNEPLFCSTAWLLQVGRGIILYLILVLLAPYLADFYEHSELQNYLYVAGLALPIMGFKSVYLEVLNRDLNPFPELKLELIAQIINSILLIALATQYQSTWILVFGHITVAVIIAIGSHWFTPKSFYRLQFDWIYLKEIIHFGKWIYFGTVGAFFMINIDKLLLGKVETIANLGIYQIATGFTMIGYMLALSLVHRIIYPVLSSAARENETHLTNMITEMKYLLFPVFSAISLFIFLSAPWFFTLLYPESFHDAIWMSQFMALAMWFMLVSNFYGTVLIASNRPKEYALVLMFISISRPILGMLFYTQYGIPGFLTGMIIGSGIGIFIYRYVLNLRLEYMDNYEYKIAIVVASIISILFAIEYLLVLPQSVQIITTLLIGTGISIGLVLTMKTVISASSLLQTDNPSATP